MWIITNLLHLLEHCSSRLMCFLSLRKANRLLLDSVQNGNVFPLLYCSADWIGQNTGCNTNDPHIFPAEKKSNQIDGGDDNRPVYKVKSHCRFIQLTDNIYSIRGMRCVLDKLRGPRSTCAGTKIHTARFGGLCISRVAQNFLYGSPDTINLIVI